MKILVIFGTRPEAVKMCPVIQCMRRKPGMHVTVCVTGQHKEMLNQVLRVFSIEPDYNLEIMRESQTLADITSGILYKLPEILKRENPELVLVHGDTSTAFAAALTCFYRQIPVGHVEAGLRTHDMDSPFPEEFNRQAIDLMAKYYFAPTGNAKKNLIAEGKRESDVFVTGNTVIDALSTTVRREYRHEELEWAKDGRLLLLTAHRRENLGNSMHRMFRAIRKVVDAFPDVKVIYPVHLNPAVKAAAEEEFGGCERVHLIAPLDVIDFHNFMAGCYLILTDSGGIQEEAPALGKPVLVMRDTTERPEGLEAGTLKLVGTDEDTIYKECARLLTDREAYLQMSRAVNPYGDGKASERIVSIIEKNGKQFADTLRNGDRMVSHSKVSLSVIVPVYNVEQYLDECLTSIAAQSVSFDQVILVNDGSTDGSREICETYCRKNQNFTLINQQNLGQSEARNAGLKIAEGDYVIFIDSDDYVESRMAEKIKCDAQLTKSNFQTHSRERSCDVLYYNVTVRDEMNAGEPRSYFIRDAKYCGIDMTGLEYLMDSFPSNYLVSPCLAAYGRKFLAERGIWFPKGIYYEDHPFCMQVILEAQKVRCIPDAFYIRRRREDSTTTGAMTEKKYCDLITVNRLIWEELKDRGIEPSFLTRVISKYLLDIRGVIRSFNHKTGAIAMETDKLLKYFVRYWLQLYMDTGKSPGDTVTLFLVLQEIKKRDKLAPLLDNYFAKGEYGRYMGLLRNEIIQNITERLREIPLGESQRKIGICGIGNHTGKLLDLYRTYVGEIHCHLYFVITDGRQSAKEFQGRALVDCDGIEPDTDLIVISSFLYQNDMYGELAKRNIPDHKIKRLYDDKDICDLICVWDVLSEKLGPGVM